MATVRRGVCGGRDAAVVYGPAGGGGTRRIGGHGGDTDVLSVSVSMSDGDAGGDGDSDSDGDAPLAIAPGDIFLIRKSAKDWVHTGVVIAMRDDHFETLEGNTDAGGGREGTAVFHRYRTYVNKDFIRLN